MKCVEPDSSVGITENPNQVSKAVIDEVIQQAHARRADGWTIAPGARADCRQRARTPIEARH